MGIYSFKLPDIGEGVVEGEVVARFRDVAFAAGQLPGSEEGCPVNTPDQLIQRIILKHMDS